MEIEKIVSYVCRLPVTRSAARLTLVMNLYNPRGAALPPPLRTYPWAQRSVLASYTAPHRAYAP